MATTVYLSEFNLISRVNILTKYQGSRVTICSHVIAGSFGLFTDFFLIFKL